LTSTPHTHTHHTHLASEGCLNQKQQTTGTLAAAKSVQGLTKNKLINAINVSVYLDMKMRTNKKIGSVRLKNVKAVGHGVGGQPLFLNL
jgi:hypothetical protein